MQTIRAKVHKGRIEPLENAPIPLEEGKEVLIFIPENKVEEELSSERQALLARIDSFRTWYGRVGSSVKDLVREGRRNG